MTFNIRHARGMDNEVNLRRIAEEIERSGADVIGLQEVDRFLPRSGAVDQPAQLARWLGMEFCYSASEDRHNTTNLAAYIRGYDAETGRDGQYGNALLSRFPITRHQRHYLASDRERRSLLQAEIAVDGHSVTVCTTHLGLDQEERTKQVETITQALEDETGPVVLMGDFNMRPDNPLLRSLSPELHKVPLREAVTTFIGPQSEKAENGIVEIDHIFISGAAHSNSAWTQPTTASDHHPVLARVRLERK